MKLFNNSAGLLLFLLSFFFIAISPQMFSHGMFMDGVYYATISRNMAIGIGSFWSPQLTDVLGKYFFEHPPLVFFLQSWFFELFGDHHWVERLYSLFTYLGAGTLTILLWKKIAPNNQKHFYWLPILFWITIPKMVWGVNNNLLENTSMLFVIGSLITQYKAMNQNNNLYYFFTGILLFLGMLSKGFTALFPLSFLFIFWFVKREFSFSKLLKSYAYIIIGLILPLLLIVISSSEAVNYLNSYLDIQIFNGMSTGREGRNRFYIIKRAFGELTPILLIVLIVYLFNRYKLKTSLLSNKKEFIIIILTALSGVLPIMFSLKQSTFYIIPTFPIFSIAAALVVAPILAEIPELQNFLRARSKWLTVSSAIFLAIGLVLLILPIHAVKRDKNQINDVLTIISHVGSNTTIGLDKSLETDYSNYAYLYRYGFISLGVNHYELPFFLTPKGKKIEDPNFTIQELNLSTLELYRKTGN